MAKCSKADVIIVATHRDRCANSDEVLNSIRQKYSRLKKVVLHGVFAVNATVRSSVEEVRNVIASIGASSTFSELFSQRAPKCFLYLKVFFLSLLAVLSLFRLW